MILLILYNCSNTFSQTFHKTEEKNMNNQGEEIWRIYEHSDFEDYQVITLFQNKSFHYKASGTSFEKFSVGKWHISKDTLILENRIDAENIPIAIKYMKDSYKDTTGLLRSFNKGPFLMSRNSKGQLFQDADIEINNDSVHYSPFLDTTFGNYKKIDSIRINFGKPFFTKWVKVKKIPGYKILAIAQIDFLLDNYDDTKERRYQIDNSTIEAIK